MSSVSDEKPTAEAALRGALDVSLRAADERALPELLLDVARGVVEAFDWEWVALVVWASDGRPELVVTAGNDAAARAAVDGPPDAGSPPLPADRADVDTGGRLSAPLLLRGRAAGVVIAGGVDGVDRADTDSALQAAASGVSAIVERARTADANRRRERWLSGGTEIARALTATPHPDPPAMIAERALDIASADAVALLSPGALPGLFRVDAVAGDGIRLSAGQQIPDTEEGHLQRVLADGRPVRIDDLGRATSRDDLLVGASILAPMNGSTGLLGVMAFGRADSGSFTEAEVGMAAMFAGTVALALELAESQSRREQIALILERDRIARDLHDHVIQRLYAIGLTMQHVSSLVGDETVERLVTAVADIDAAIAQIRSTIFRLTTPILSADVSLRARADTLVDELEPVLGYRPSLVSEGPLDFGLDDELVTDCEAVLREGITNIARHAQATRADVSIFVGRDLVQITISDDGRGLGETDRRSGLANMRQRAEQHGGTLDIMDNGGRGTCIVWTVPLGE